MKRITKKYNFSRTKDINNLPNYVNDYIFDDEKVIVVYTTQRDHGVFTDKKIILFDNRMSLREKRELVAIPYNAICSLSTSYKVNSAALKIYLNNGNFISLKFIRMLPADKMRLRYLSTVIMQIINKQNVDQKSILKLNNNDFKIE